MRTIGLSALILIGSLGISGIAEAGCCDDFWSCAAAVATGGLSCQIQSLVDSVTQLKQTVETLISSMSTQVRDVIAQAQRGVNDAANDLKQLRSELAGQLKSNADEAHALANPVVVARPMLNANKLAPVSPAAPAAAAAVKPALVARGGVALPPPPKPADPAQVKDAFKRAEQYLQGVLASSANPGVQANQFAEAALAAAARHLHTAQQISLDMALAPLNLLRDSLLDLLTHPERIFDPSAQINADVQRVATQVPAMFEKITNEITQEALADLNQGSSFIGQLQESASGGQSIVAAMHKVSDSQLQTDLDELNRLLPAPAAPARAGLALKPVFTLAPSVLALHRQRLDASVAHALPAKLPIVIQQRASASLLSSHWQSFLQRTKTKVALEAGSTQRVERDLGQMYAGKKGADIAKKKSELLAEAKRRFGKDPKTLAKVQQYIEAHTPKG